MTGDPLVVRRAGPGDVGAVVDLVQSAYRGETSRQGWTTEADLLDGQRVDAQMLGETLARPGHLVLVALQHGEHDGGPDAGDEVVACCHLEQRERTVYLGMFAVRPGLQGQGYGRRMLEAAEQQAREWGAEAVEITVLSHRPELVAWYERRGFVATGEDHPFPYGDPRFGLPRREDLVLRGMVRPLP